MQRLILTRESNKMFLISNYLVWFIILIIIYETPALSYNQPKLGSNARWCENGTTFADNSTICGSARGFFVSYNDTVFVAAHQKSQILIWSKENIIVRSISVKLPDYPTLFVTINGDIYFVNGNELDRIDKWTMNSINSVMVTKFSGHCVRLFVDTNNTLYCSFYAGTRIVKKSLDEVNATEITVAGTDSRGAAPDELSWSWGIFVDTNFDLYVADAGNNRIQLFRLGQQNGTTVVGKGIPQDLSLNFPTDVILDADSYLYIADAHNSRIIRSGYGEWQCIVGCSRQEGSAPNELRSAYGIHFDSRGNLFVADEFNNRIQKFLLATDSCVQQSTSTLAPFTCSTEHIIGSYCNISNTLCDMLQPCENDGICNETDAATSGYNCSCSFGFIGKRCEIDNRPCKVDTCWNNGTCTEISNTSFRCDCELGWEGTHCERRVNRCQNVTCQNRGVCRPLFRGYKCECLGDNYYSGDHCEEKTNRIVIFNIVSKSCGYIAIIVIVATAMFIIIMDILKYCFGIDLTCEELERIRRKKLTKKRKPVIQRFIYVNAPSPPQSSNPITEDTIV